MKFPCVIDNIEEVFDGDWGIGPLTLGIWCTECGSQFELNKEAVAMAAITGATFVDFLKYVQNSPCERCGLENEN